MVVSAGTALLNSQSLKMELFMYNMNAENFSHHIALKDFNISRVYKLFYTKTLVYGQRTRANLFVLTFQTSYYNGYNTASISTYADTQFFGFNIN